MRLIRLSVVATVIATSGAMAGSVSPGVAAADGCASTTYPDFNGDGRADVVVGDPVATAGGSSMAGALLVRYGSGDGQIGGGSSAVVTLASSTSAANQVSAEFGRAVAAGDANCDGYTDVLVGMPYYNHSGVLDAGAVVLVKGSAAGLGALDNGQIFYESHFGGDPNTDDRFGMSVDLVEDVGQGGTPEPDAYAMAVGIPNQDVAGEPNAGAVALRVPLDGGSETFIVNQDTPGVPGVSEEGDNFGHSVAWMYTGSGSIDLVVGVPRENVGSKGDAGQIAVFQDIYDMTFADVDIVDQNTSGVSSTVEANDRFGFSVAAARSGSSVYVVVGAPGEGVGSKTNAGLVQLFKWRGSTFSAVKGITQDSSGVSGTAESDDYFGAAVAVNATAAGTPYVAVGAVGEDGSAGAAQTFKFTKVSSDKYYTQSSAGVAGAKTAGDSFGGSVGLFSRGSHNVLVVGVPNDNDNAAGMVNVIPYLGGAASHQHWLADGLAGATFFQFGSAVAPEGN